MAKMIPVVIDPEQAKKSRAEADVFGWLKNMSWGNATVLYSLPLKDHIKKSFGEIDFVVISDKGIICLEVKGGGVERKNGQWGFTNRFGETTWKSEGPYIQAQGNMKSLRSYLEKNLKADDEILKCRWACCVITPDCVIKTDNDTEVIPEITFNGNMSEQDLPALFERSFKYWHEKKHYGGESSLNGKAKERLVTFLRGDFNFVPPLSVIMNRSDEQLLSTTEEQLEIIMHMCVNDRMMVEGGAGTGKTLLAAEQCRRAYATGEKVLYLCLNHVIASYIYEMFEAEGLGGAIDVYRFHELLMKACDIKEIPDDAETFFSSTLPDLFMSKSEGSKLLEKYDRIIIDEGQDLMNMTAYLCINELVEGGWENGKWTIYYDASQNIFRTDTEFEEVWKELKNSSFIYPLTVNCRNTRQIAQGNYAVTHVYKPKYMRAEGLDVVYKTYGDKKQEAKELFYEIRRLKAEGIAKKDIVILSYYRMDNPKSCLYGVTVPADIGPIRVNQVNHFADCKQIRFYTIQAFKGLEAKAVIMIDVDNFSDNDKRKLNYVGMSRARTYLVFFYDKTLQQERQQRLLDSLL